LLLINNTDKIKTNLGFGYFYNGMCILGVQWGTIAVFSLTVPLHIESLYNFGGTGPILGVKKPLQRVNGHAELNSRNLHELAL
jgi:hypothetical protein